MCKQYWQVRFIVRYIIIDDANCTNVIITYCMLADPVNFDSNTD